MNGFLARVDHGEMAISPWHVIVRVEHDIAREPENTFTPSLKLLQHKPLGWQRTQYQVVPSGKEIRKGSPISGSLFGDTGRV